MGEFRRRCLATVAGHDVEVLTAGRHHLVVRDRDRVFRFPRRPAGAARIAELAARHDRAAAVLTLAPAVRDWTSGPVGTAHLVLDYRPGTTLLARGSLGADAAAVTAALRQLRDVTGTQWAHPGPATWAEVWTRLPGRVALLSGHHRDETLAAWQAAAERAAAAARQAPSTLLHGDLPANLLVTSDGRISAIIDFDDAVIGDPAMDTAAVLHHLPGPAAAEIARRSGDLAGDLARFDAYQATWPLQAALWRAEHGA